MGPRYVCNVFMIHNVQYWRQNYCWISANVMQLQSHTHYTCNPQLAVLLGHCIWSVFISALCVISSFPSPLSCSLPRPSLFLHFPPSPISLNISSLSLPSPLLFPSLLFSSPPSSFPPSSFPPSSFPPSSSLPSSPHSYLCFIPYTRISQLRTISTYLHPSRCRSSLYRP